MPACLTQTESGYVITPNASACPSGWMLLTDAEYQQQNTISTALAMPSQEELGQLFQFGFSIPLIAWLTAHAFKSIINMIPSR